MDIITGKFDKLFFLGDTHGENMGIGKLLQSTKSSKQFDEKAIIHVGDFGIGFCASMEEELHLLDKLNTILIQNRIYLFVVRGNHDDPNWFDNTSPMSNITFIKDHTLLEFILHFETMAEKKVKIYCNGGATSIDRSGRKLQKTYWVDEKFTCPNDSELLEIPTDLNVIVTHNRPLGCHPTVFNEAVLNYSNRDKNLLLDLQNEQVEIKKLFDSIRKRNISRNNIVHYFGHYHWSHRERIGDIAHVTLAIKELAEYRC